jgi:hypothetical protein
MLLWVSSYGACAIHRLGKQCARMSRLTTKCEASSVLVPVQASTLAILEVVDL